MSSGLISYLIRRSLLMLLTLWLVSFMVFSLVRIVPGDTVTALIFDTGLVPEENIDAVRAELGLDKSFIEQYWVWFSHLLRGDFGDSLIRRESTLTEIQEALPVTVQLALMSIALSLVIAIPLGVVAATRRNSLVDHFTRVFGSVGIAIPDFFLGTVVIILMGRYLGYLPPLGFQPFWDDPLVNLEQLWIPASIVAIRLSAVTMRMTRSVTIEVLTQDYIRTARAKGLSGKAVTTRHALRNALLPVLTIIGAQFGLLLGGALIMETLFALPGLGTSTLTAITRRDYSQLQTNALFIGAVVVTMNLLIDLTYSVLDPRVRLN
jgi:peptide/nickel transport system permease protein